MRNREPGLRAGRVLAALAITIVAATACSPVSARTATVSGTITVPPGIARSDDTVVDVSISRPGEETIVASTLAESDGHYAISGLAPDVYALHVSVFDANVAPQWWGGSTTARDADVFEVTAGEHRSGMDVSLVRGSTLSGTVTMPAGREDQVRHTWVTVWDARERTWHGDAAVSTNGEYAVDGLAAGDYKVEVIPARTAGARQWVGGSSDWSNARSIAVAASEHQDGADAALTIGGAISGRVGGVAAAELGATVYTELLADDGAWEGGGWVDVDADGSFTLRGIAPGRHAVRFSRPIGDHPWDDADTASLHQSSEAEPSHSKYWDNKPDPRSADLVLVTEGATVEGINANLDAPPPANP